MRSKIGYADPHVLLQIFNLFVILLLFSYLFPLFWGMVGLFVGACGSGKKRRISWDWCLEDTYWSC